MYVLPIGSSVFIGLPPIVDDFIEPFAGQQCYTVFDLFWGFYAHTVHPQSRDLTAFLTPLGLLRLTSLPMGYTNSLAEFQKCMSFILHDKILDVANIFIDDLPIKGPESRYLMENGEPEVLKENPGIQRFIWEHAEDVHRIIHRVRCAGGTFASNKAQILGGKVIGTLVVTQGLEKSILFFKKKLHSCKEWNILPKKQS